MSVSLFPILYFWCQKAFMPKSGQNLECPTRPWYWTILSPMEKKHRHPQQGRPAKSSPIDHHTATNPQELQEATRRGSTRRYGQMGKREEEKPRSILTAARWRIVHLQSDSFKEGHLITELARMLSTADERVLKRHYKSFSSEADQRGLHHKNQ
ncbi:Protein CBG21466 [Caenorhabditis briggsae]|uniref:Protein CBG21466 n=1 Tax=Caenorhabditis briggsae TaxID=6238 RepID=A8Y040_CAEBR|nr:Protein CBG21466 [Caenorhabditis briggsae]CAP38258.1 Protein CBG21466 [Caenorhabditis briggsae]